MKNRKKSKETDPTMKIPGALLWILCAPAALVISANHDANKSIKKRKAKKAKKEAEFRRKYPEWWFYSD